MRRFKTFALLCLLYTVAFILARPCFGQGMSSVPDVRYTFVTLSAPGTTENYATVPDAVWQLETHFPTTHVVQAFVTGAPTGCAFTVYGSLKLPSENPVSTDFQALGNSVTCTSGAITFITDEPVATIQIRLTALSGGTSPTVTFRYLGKHF